MPTEIAGLDTHDARILEELQRDARITMAELGRRVHLSQPAVSAVNELQRHVLRGTNLAALRLKLGNLSEPHPPIGV